MEENRTESAIYRIVPIHLLTLDAHAAILDFGIFYVTVSSHIATVIAQDVMNVKPQAQSVNY